MFGINDSKIGIDLDGGIGFMNTVCTLWKDKIRQNRRAAKNRNADKRKKP